MLIRWFVFIILFYLLYKIINVFQSKHVKNDDYQFNSSSTEAEDLVKDPVCNTYIPRSQAYKREISGKDYYFCSKQCGDRHILEKNN